VPRRIDPSDFDFAEPSARRALESSAMASLIRLVGFWTSEDFQGGLAERAGVNVESRDVPGLFLLGQRGPTRPGDLARNLRVSAAAVSKLTDRLVGGGYALRRPDPDDARASLITLTEAGADAAQALYDEGERLFASLLTEWPASDATKFAALLIRFTEQFELD
jgi:DNA-binding MarR family transcriptional regulator